MCGDAITHIGPYNDAITHIGPYNYYLRQSPAIVPDAGVTCITYLLERISLRIWRQSWYLKWESPQSLIRFLLASKGPFIQHNLRTPSQGSHTNIVLPLYNMIIFSPKYTPKTLHSSPVRARYGVSIVCSKSGLNPILFIITLYVTVWCNRPWYTEVQPDHQITSRYNGKYHETRIEFCCVFCHVLWKIISWYSKLKFLYLS